MFRRSTALPKRQNNIPSVRLARPKNRPIQLRYTCPKQKREFRISTGTRDELEAERQKKELEAKLLLGIEITPRKQTRYGPDMDWESFRYEYSTLHLTSVREDTVKHAESRLDLAERILKPRTLGDVANTNALQQLQTRLLQGEQSRRKKPRSKYTVRGYMKSIMAAINWAHSQGWLPQTVVRPKLKVPRNNAMKGRPITEQEFELMLKSTEVIVGEETVDAWEYILKGLWSSALRLNELMHVSWDMPGTIRPVWKEGQHPILSIPAALQKNDTDEEIPLLPWFEEVLLETPVAERSGWVFEPASLQTKYGRKMALKRPESEWVGKVISKIGKASGVVVAEADAITGRPTKYVSAHDLRRSCGDRLRNIGVHPLVISRVMRHSSWDTTQKHYAPGNIQSDADTLRKVLK